MFFGKLTNYLILSSLLISVAVSAMESKPLIELETITIQEKTNSSDFDFKTDYNNLTNSTAYQKLINPKKKIKNKICKKFGPVEFNFKLNPFNMDRTGIILDIDLLESYEIISDKPTIEELKIKLKPSTEHKLVSDEVKTQFNKIKTWFNEQQEAS